MKAIFQGTIGVLGVAALAACGSASEDEATPAPTERPTATASAPTADDDIRHFLLQEYPDAGAIHYALAWSDLNGDGKDEAIVYPIGPYFCGSGGCNTLILTSAGAMWRKVGEISVSRTPVTVLESSTKGWKDLTVDIAGGGGAPGIARLKFDGESYPGNPTVPPAEPTQTRGKVLLPEQPELRTAAPDAAEGAPSAG